MNIVLPFASLCLLLIVGKVLRVKVRLFQKLYLPASVIAGLLGLAVIQTVSMLSGGPSEGGDVQQTGLFASHVGPFVQNATAGWNILPGFLINIVFASLFLGVTVPPLKSIWQKAGPQLAYGQIVAWGQYATALGISLAILVPLFKVQGFMGTIIPVGFEGGHGTAGGLAETFKFYNWPDGADYALAAATAGLLFAIIVGMILINWAARSGFAQKLQRIEDMPESSIIGVYQVEERPIAGRQTVSSASVDSLALHLAVIGVAVFIAYLFKQALMGTETAIRGLGEDEQPFFTGFPLFPLCMIGGLIVQVFLDRFAKINPVDHQLMQRLSGTAMDFLVVAAISIIRLEVVMKGILPFAILVAVGVLWNAFCVTWLARRLLPKDSWFERAIAEMGQSMGVTATGLLLLRVVDPEGETDAVSAFGYKQILHEPFMGGGLWTSAAIPLAITVGALPVFLISAGAIAVWLVVWAALFRKTCAEPA